MNQSEQKESIRDGAADAVAVNAMDEDVVSFEPPESETDPDTGDPDFPVDGA